MTDSRKSDCTQCGAQRSIVAVREVCRDCHAHDKRLSKAQWDLYEATLEGDKTRAQTAVARLTELMR